MMESRLFTESAVIGNGSAASGVERNHARFAGQGLESPASVPVHVMAIWPESLGAVVTVELCGPMLPTRYGDGVPERDPFTWPLAEGLKANSWKETPEFR